MELLIIIGIFAAFFWGIKIMAQIGFSFLKLIGVIILVCIFGWNVGIVGFAIWALFKLFSRR